MQAKRRSYPQGSDPKKRQRKPFWERTYHGHAYWQGKAKLGRVMLDATRAAGEHGRYRWEAAGRLGEAESLQKAKAAVELAVALSDRQLPLFD
ncbi:MAG: hypothetical protein R3357_10980 [Burkholderiales bacterium]|nr:hypothetical protein [Burkholderiales bacterium]